MASKGTVRNLLGSPPTGHSVRAGRTQPGELLASPLQRGVSHNAARPRHQSTHARAGRSGHTCGLKRSGRRQSRARANRPPAEAIGAWNFCYVCLWRRGGALAVPHGRFVRGADSTATGHGWYRCAWSYCAAGINCHQLRRNDNNN